MKNIKIQLVPTKDTALVCICCLGFRTEYAVQPVHPNMTPAVGVHANCIQWMHVKRGGDHERSEESEGHRDGSEPASEG